MNLDLFHPDMDYSSRVYILDTDIGDDIDDALTLAIAARLPNFRLAGVTTVFKNTRLRARLARQLLIAARKQMVPVYAGEQCTDEKFCQYDDSLLDPRYDYDTTLSAHDFMIQAANKYGADLTIIAIGALSNVAMAIEKDPQAMGKIGGICAMGGAFFRHCNEWNIRCDPWAAAVVFDFPIVKKFAGLDVTLPTKMTPKNVRRALEKDNPVNQLLAAYARRWATNWDRASVMYLHDQVAFYTALFPLMARDCGGILTYAPASVGVCEEGITRGTTFNYDTDHWFDTNPIPPNCMVGTEIDADSFQEWVINACNQ